jgi:ribosomal protein S18 acetylase RimI-like enzyme
LEGNLGTIILPQTCVQIRGRSLRQSNRDPEAFCGRQGIPMTIDPSPPVVVRPVAETDVEGFHACLDAVAGERAYLGFIEGPPLEKTRSFILENISLDIPQFVAVRQGEVVGWCDVSPETLPGFTHCGRLGMGVRKEFRGRGLGRKLLEAALQKAKARGLERIELEVFASNRAAIELYTSSGFVAEGIRTRGRKLDGEYEDVIFMVKFLP